MNADECNCKHIDYRGTCDNRNVFYSDSECLMLQDMPCHYYEEDITNQYNAVVAQNKSLQGELNIYKRMVNNMANFNILNLYPNHSIEQRVFEFKQQALQELEAEND